MMHPSATGGAEPVPIGHWVSNGAAPADSPAALRDAIGNLNSPVVVLYDRGAFAVASGGTATLGEAPKGAKSLPVYAYLPPLPPSSLGDPTFREDHALKY